MTGTVYVYTIDGIKHNSQNVERRVFETARNLFNQGRNFSLPSVYKYVNGVHHYETDFNTEHVVCIEWVEVKDV